MGKVAKGKRKTWSKNEKIGKCAEGQDNESTYSSQNYDSRRLLMFSYQGWYLHKQKETSFQNLCLTFCFVRNLDDSVELRQYQLLSQRTFFFLPKAFFRFWFFLELRVFHKQKVCTCEFVMYAMQTKYANNMKNEPQDEQKIPLRDASDTFLIYQLITQSTFFK